MKSAVKFLKSSQKLEQNQLARRAKDIDDIQAFDEQKEAQKTARFRKQTVFERHAQQWRAGSFSRPEFEENAWGDWKQDELENILRHDNQATTAKITASDAEIAGLEDLQNALLREQNQDEMKELTAAQEHPFSGEFADVIDVELRREIEENRQAVGEPAPRLDLAPKKQTPPMIEELSALTMFPDAELAKNIPIEPPHEEAQTVALVEQGETLPKKRSETVFYFRSTPNSKS